jgi:hypothetical protein
VAEKLCQVSFSDLDGFRHSVEVSADSLYEAAVLAVHTFKKHEFEPAPGTPLEIEVKGPSVVHTVTLKRVHDWLNCSAKTPRDRVKKDRLKAMLG